MVTSDGLPKFSTALREKPVSHVTDTHLSEDNKSWMKAVGKTKTLSFPSVLILLQIISLRALHWDIHYAEDKPL